MAHGLPLDQPERLSTPQQQAALRGWEPDVLVVVAYGLLLPPSVLALPRLGCVNVHPSLLPRWRGAAPIQRTVLAGDPETGISLMQMDAGLDTGPVLLQERTPLSPEESAGALHDRLAAHGAQTLLRALEGLAQGTLHPVPQPEEGVTYAAKLEKSESCIDWTRPATALLRQVRGLNPWPVAETGLLGEPLKIFDAQVVPDAGERAQPGEIVAVKDSILVQCAQDRLALREVQRPGRRRMAAKELAHSLPLLGQRLG